MNNINKILYEVEKTQNIINSGYAKQEELESALNLVKSFTFNEEFFIRKAHKLLNPSSPFKSYVVISGFISKSESAQLEPWIALLNEYKEYKN